MLYGDIEEVFEEMFADQFDPHQVLWNGVNKDKYLDKIKREVNEFEATLK